MSTDLLIFICCSIWSIVVICVVVAAIMDHEELEERCKKFKRKNKEKKRIIKAQKQEIKYLEISIDNLKKAIK